MDIHLEKGMHCVDCHFYQDGHGDTKLYGEVRAAIEIQCIDCHGTAAATLPEIVAAQLSRGDRPRLATSGPAAPEEGTNLLLLRTPFDRPRFEIVCEPGEEPKLIQRSNVEPDLEWDVTQTAATVRPGSPDYNPRSHAAKTVRRGDDGRPEWGGTSAEDYAHCPHNNDNMNCIACHSSWNPSCFGCHLPQKANIKSPELHNQGDVTRNRTSYNFQTLRDDVFMLARDGNVTGNRIGPARSSCAIHVSSYNANRETIYIQQQTISSDGLSGIAFSTNVPHTVRGGPGPENEHNGDRAGTFETKSCTDCHLSAANDNNAMMAQLLMQGTGFHELHGQILLGRGRRARLRSGRRHRRDEPQAVIGSTLHELAFPNSYEEHVKRQSRIEHATSIPGRTSSKRVSSSIRKPEVLDLQHRGEYLYAACGTGGLRVFDIAFIDHKAFQRTDHDGPRVARGPTILCPHASTAQAVARRPPIAPDPTRKPEPVKRRAQRSCDVCLHLCRRQV